MEQPVILYVDQDIHAYPTLDLKIENEHAVFKRVSKSTDALLLLQKEPICLIILDAESCTLPIEEIVPIIRGLVRDVPIIVTCGRNSPDLEKQVRAQNVFYYHLKSFGISDLEMAVRNALEKYRSKYPRA